jgi:plastocyanin
MRRGPLLPVVIASSAMLFAAGCGSSSSGSSSATTKSTASTSAASGGLKTDSTPKYAAPAASAPVQSGTVQVAYRNIAIDPDTIKVKVGSTIKWTDYDDVTHNVTSQSGPAKFASANLHEGSTFSYKVTKPGVIHYECTYHPASMNGSIEVVK